MSRLKELKHFLHNSPSSPDVVAIEETNLQDRKNPKIDGYVTIRQDNPKTKRGGLLILLKIGINHTRLQLDQIPDVESQGVEIITDQGKIKLINVYIHPPPVVVSKAQLLKLFPENDKRSIVVGDLNAHSQTWKDSSTSTRGRILEEVVSDRELVILNTGSPTYITNTTTHNNSVIDLAISTRDMALRCNHTVLNNCLGSDHLVSMVTVDEVAELEEDVGMHRWKLEKADWKAYKEQSRVTINPTIITDNLDDTMTNLIKAINNTAATTIPERKPFKTNKSKRRKTKPLPFWNENCTNTIYERNKIRNRANKSGNMDDWIAFKEKNARSRGS